MTNQSSRRVAMKSVDPTAGGQGVQCGGGGCKDAKNNVWDSRPIRPRQSGSGSSSNSRSARLGMRLIVEVLDLNDARPTPFPQIVEGNSGVLEQT